MTGMQAAERSGKRPEEEVVPGGNQWRVVWTESGRDTQVDERHKVFGGTGSAEDLSGDQVQFARALLENPLDGDDPLVRAQKPREVGGGCFLDSRLRNIGALSLDDLK